MVSHITTTKVTVQKQVVIERTGRPQRAESARRISVRFMIVDLWTGFRGIPVVNRRGREIDRGADARLKIRLLSAGSLQNVWAAERAVHEVSGLRRIRTAGCNR